MKYVMKYVKKTFITISLIYIMIIGEPMIYILSIASTNRIAYITVIGITLLLSLINILFIKKEKEFILKVIKIIMFLIILAILIMLVYISNSLFEKIFWVILLILIISEIIRNIIKEEK